MVSMRDDDAALLVAPLAVGRGVIGAGLDGAFPRHGLRRGAHAHGACTTATNGARRQKWRAMGRRFCEAELHGRSRRVPHALAHERHGPAHDHGPMRTPKEGGRRSAGNGVTILVARAVLHVAVVLIVEELVAASVAVDVAVVAAASAVEGIAAPSWGVREVGTVVI
jgi:hypothetical protein